MAKAKIDRIYQTKKSEPTSSFGASITSDLESVYVPAKLTTEDQVTKEMHLVSIEDLLTFKKMLIQGESGSGKSTLTNQILNNQFVPYKFKVKLQLLLQENWKSFYGTKYVDNPVACIIHYSLTQLINRDAITAQNRVSLDEIEDILTNHADETLLLLDGYDSIARFDEKDPTIREFIDELLKATKYSIMTSRPDFLSVLRTNYFELKAQISRFDSSETEIFIKKSLTTQQAKLLEITNAYFKQHADTSEHDLLASLRASTNQINLEAYFMLNQILFHHKTKTTSPMAGAAAARVEKAPPPQQSTTEAINTYYHNQKLQLLQLLTYPAIRELASNPMQARMLCSAISDPEMSGELTASFTVHKLYQNILDMIGRRFIELNSVVTESTTSAIIDLPEFKALKEIAYNTFGSRKIIKSTIIEEIARKYGTTTQSIIKIGLLKTAIKAPNGPGSEDSAQDLLAVSLPVQEYTFMHQSFEEFLAASHLSTLLHNPKLDKSVEDAALFIAYHRNEPQHLLLLKFIAGMLSNEPNSQGTTLAITRFWEAIECNIDRVLELGVDKKVILFMHLLAQTKHDGRIDPRIPNLSKVVEFIDKVVLSNFIIWQEKLKESGYLSPSMIDIIWTTLENSSFTGFPSTLLSAALEEDDLPEISSLNLLSTSYDEKAAEEQEISTSFKLSIPSTSIPIRDSRSSLKSKSESPSSEYDLLRSPNLANKTAQRKTIIEISGNFIHNLDNFRLYQALLRNIGNKKTDWIIKRSSINIITIIILNQEEAFVSTTNDDLINTIYILVDLIKNANLRKASVNAIKAFISVRATESIAVLDKLISILKTGVNDNSLNQLVYDIIIQTESTEQYLPILLEHAVHHAVALPLTITDMERSQSDEKTILDITNDVQNSALAIITELVKSQPNVINLIITTLIEFLKTGTNTSAVADFIGKILMIDNSDMQQEFFRSIMHQLKDNHSKTAVINAINAVIENHKIGGEFSNQLLIEFITILTALEDEGGINQFNIIGAIIKITKISENLDDTTREFIFTKLLEHSTIPNTVLALAHIVNTDNIGHVQNVFEIITTIINTHGTLSLSDEEALLILTSRNINLTQAREFLSYLRAIHNIPDFIVLPIANLVTKLDIVEPEILSEIGTNLISSINQHNYSKVISALNLIMAKYIEITTSYIEALMNQLEGLSSSLDPNIKHQIIKLISKHITADSALIEKILAYSFALLEDEISEKPTLAKSISILLIKAPTHISHTMTARILPLLDHSDSAYTHIATLILSKIFKSYNIPSSDRHLNLLHRMILLIKDDKPDLNALNVVISILQRLEKGKDHAHINSIFHQLMSSISSHQASAAAESHNSQADAYVGYIISKMIDKIDQPTDKTLQLILSKLRSLQDSSLVEDIKNSMHKIIELMSIEATIKLLKNPCPVIRTSVIKVLTQKLSADKIGTVWNDKVLNLLKIIGNDLESSDQETLLLYDSARRKLLDLCKEPDPEEVHLKWVVENFDVLVKASKTESEKMMEIIFYYVLSDSKITPLEAEFIQKCVNILGFTITISMPHTSENNIVFIIQYASKIYELHGEENRKHVEMVAAAVLAQNNILIQQHVNYKPLFPNTGSAIQPAAIDIAECNSLVDNSKKLSLGSYKLSLLYLSDNAKSTPKDQFVLLETRHAGYYVAHMIYINRVSKIFIKAFTQHPNRLDIVEFRVQIFGEMSYDDPVNNPRYFISKPFDIEYVDGENLLNNIKDTIPAPLVTKTVHLHRFKSVFFFDLRGASSPPSSEGRIRRGSVDLDKKKAIDSSITPPNLIKLISKYIPNIPTHITGDWEKDLEHFIEFRRDELYINVDRTESNNRLRDELLANLDLTRKAQGEVAKIKANSYKRAFYFEVIELTHAVYTAALADKSGMIDTHDPESTLDTVGGAAVSVSSYIPVVGAGVAILGQILQGLSDSEKADKLTNFRRFFETPDEVNPIAEKFARKLTKLTLQIPKNQIEEVISTATQILQGGVAAATSMLASAAKSAFAEEKEDEDFTRGQNDGAIIANFIIRRIFDGYYKDFVKKTHLIKGSTQEDKARLLIDSVKDQFDPSSVSSKEHSISAPLAVDDHLLKDKKHLSINPANIRLSTALNSPLTLVDSEQQGEAVPIIGAAGGCHCTIMAVTQIVYANPLFNSQEYEDICRKLPREKQTEALKAFYQYAHDIPSERESEFLSVFSKLYLQSPSQITIKDITPEDSLNLDENSLEQSIVLFTSEPADLSTAQSSAEDIAPSSSFFEIFSLSDLLNPSFLLKKLFYKDDLEALYTFLDKKGIKIDITSEKDLKKVFLAIHSDKGGSDQDFIFVNGIRDKLKQDIWQDLYKALEGQFKTIESVLHKTSISFKLLDTSVDAARLALEPTLNNGKAVLLDLNYLYTMSYGANKFSLVINSADIGYKLYQGKIGEALTQAGITASYMIIPTIIASVGGTPASLAYSVIITGHSGYKALQNTYSFYIEYSTPESISEEASFMMTGINNSTEVIE